MSSIRLSHDPERNDGSIITLVNDVFRKALELGASDIHIEPHQASYRIRFRQDGLLFPILSLPLSVAARVLTRLKIMANLDIAEKRLPQDGRLSLAEFTRVHVRINTCPSLWGEKIVLRLQPMTDTSLTLEQLGMTTTQQKILQQRLSEPYGLLLVAGPTGSGKTQTLYATLRYLNSVNRNIVTLEDPVEIELSGITQINVQPKIGLNFPGLLRTILRQDPDIIMVGEIRDPETAAIAIQAACTGHLVLSTLHANQASDALLRLQALGISEQDFENVSPCVIAQRLVRCLCTNCKKLKIIGGKVFEPQGCHACLDGYRGRTGIFELQDFKQPVTPAFLVKNSHSSKLWDAGWQKVEDGITSLEELSRTLGHVQSG